MRERERERERERVGTSMKIGTKISEMSCDPCMISLSKFSSRHIRNPTPA